MKKKYVDVKILEVKIKLEVTCPYCKKNSEIVMEQIDEIEITCPHCDVTFVAELSDKL
jgi:uncharacterized Zn-finger protein